MCRLPLPFSALVGCELVPYFHARRNQPVGGREQDVRVPRLRRRASRPRRHPTRPRPGGSWSGAARYRERGECRRIPRPRGPRARYLSFAEREEIALLRAQSKGVREIARTVGRDPGTVSRELRRNAATRSGKLEYRASVAQWKADMVARRPKTPKLVADPRLHALRPRAALGPDPSARRHEGGQTATAAVHRQQQTASQGPGLGAGMGPGTDRPPDVGALYIQGRGLLKRELVWCLRTGRAPRAPREWSRRKTWAPREVLPLQS